jgi:hypothetical protein
MASDYDLCNMNRTIIPALNKEGRIEIERRGIDCGEYRSAFREEDERKMAAQQARKEQEERNRSMAAQQLRDMQVLCSYCASIYPRESYGKCKGINSYSCGSLWSSEKEGALLRKREFSNCRQYGSRLSCEEN